MPVPVPFLEFRGILIIFGDSPIFLEVTYRADGFNSMGGEGKRANGIRFKIINKLYNM
jgi:hypothetical protein